MSTASKGQSGSRKVTEVDRDVAKNIKRSIEKSGDAGTLHYVSAGLIAFGLWTALDGSTFIGIVSAIIVWSLLHVISPFIYPVLAYCFGRKRWGKMTREAYLALSPEKRVYWRRLARSQIYYFGAAFIGPYLLYSRYDFVSYFTLDENAQPVRGLLTSWDPVYDFAFAAAAGHWAVTIYEDFKSRQFLAVDLDKSKTAQGKEVKLEFDANKAIFWAYLVHHLMTFVAYTFCLHTRLLSSLCCMGLAFEVPVLFLNVREFVIVFNKDMDIVRRLPPRFLSGIWNCIFLTTLCFRYNSILIYAWSVLFWRDALSELSLPTWLLYHALGLFFTCLNLYWTGLLFVWVSQDAYKVKHAELAKRGHGRSPLRSSTKNDDGALGSDDDEDDNGPSKV